MSALARLNRLRLRAMERVELAKSEVEAKLAATAVFCFLEAMEIVADAEAQAQKKRRKN